MEITLIYPHQLFARNPALAMDRPIHLIEDTLFFGNDPHWPTAMHSQKIMLHRASMKAYAAELKAAGYQIHYHDAINALKLPDEITSLHLADPVDDVLMRRLKRFATARHAKLIVHSSPNFLSPASLLDNEIGSRKKPFMARFYQAQRKRMKLLLDPVGLPLGGRWSFDQDNRAKLPKNHKLPGEPRAPRNEHTREAADYVASHFADNPGSCLRFRWPVTRCDAEVWFESFLDERLEHFGRYEDAVSTDHATLYHSAISPMLNIGLLDPQDVIKRILARADQIPLNSLEGIVRQIVGWREFMRGIYQHRGVIIRNGNFWNFTSPIPQAFYDATTGIPPVDRVIRQLLDDGWCHHIERLMILGNFMLLCRIRPDDVHRWFMEMFVDSYDWVMVPNIYGMSQFADGGTFTTKPYFSGSNYLLKMSDEAEGSWCRVWDGLFWSFIADHEAFFLRNPRLSMMVRIWHKLAPEKQAAHLAAAAEFLAGLGHRV